MRTSSLPSEVFKRCADLLIASQAWESTAWLAGPWDAGVALVQPHLNAGSQLQIARDLGISRDQVRFVGERIGVLQPRPSRRKDQ